MQINAVNERRQNKSSMGIGHGLDATPDISDGPTQIGMISQMGVSRKLGTAQKFRKDEYSSQDYKDNDSGDEVDHASSIKLRNKLPPLGQEHNMMRNLINVVDEHGYATNERSAAGVDDLDRMLDQPSSMKQQHMSPDELRFDHSLDSNEWTENLQKQKKGAISVASATRKSNKSAKNNAASNGYIQQQINMQIQ